MPSDTNTQTAAPSPLLIDAKETRRLLDLGERTLWTLTNCNAIPHYRVGRKSLRYAPAELAAWIACGCPTAPGSADRIREAVRQ